MSSTEILVGADPEVFVVDKSFRTVPAWGLIPGTKEAPERCADGATQVDGLALEFNINPARNKDEFVNRITSVVDVLRKKIPDDLSLCFIPYAHFNLKEYEALPDEAKQLGCDPDFSIQSVNPFEPRAIPDRIVQANGRSAAGHVHIGWTKDRSMQDEDHLNEVLAMTQQVTWLYSRIGIPFNFPSARTSWYGQSGIFRPKPYGVEFRSPDNLWVRTPETMAVIYQLVIRAAEDLMEGKMYQKDMSALQLAQRDINALLGPAGKLHQEIISDMEKNFQAQFDKKAKKVA